MVAEEGELKMMNLEELKELYKKLLKEMDSAVKDLDFIEAGELKKESKILKN